LIERNEVVFIFIPKGAFAFFISFAEGFSTVIISFFSVLYSSFFSSALGNSLFKEEFSWG
jgi:hypothetical protein